MPSRSQKDVKYPRVWLSILIGFFVFFAWAATVLWVGEVYNNVRFLMGVGWQAHVLGSFLVDEGNPGTIQFDARPTDGYSGAHLFIPETGPQVLTGSFWTETIGWIWLQDVEFILTNTASSIWSLSGYGWSEMAGWVDFSGTEYRLSNTSFSGYAWNDGIGWINLDGATIELTSSGAIGKVKILWTLGWNNSYNTTYIVNPTIRSITPISLINEVRKNVAIITRNLPESLINNTLGTYNVFDTTSGGGTEAINWFAYFENTSATPARVNYTSNIQSRFENIWNTQDPVYTAIVVGGDIYIDDSVLPQEDDKPRALIALKNENGVWGNIYINGWVTKIKSTLVAEGNLYSWMFWAGWTWSIYNNDPSDLFQIPNRQLHIYGSLISNNTIGWYNVDNTIANYCPYNIDPCSDSTAIIYDMNHFRDFQRDKPEWEKAILRWYEHPTDSNLNSIYDDYSIVIEHDIRLLSSPPPWLESQQ